METFSEEHWDIVGKVLGDAVGETLYQRPPPYWGAVITVPDHVNRHIVGLALEHYMMTILHVIENAPPDGMPPTELAFRTLDTTERVIHMMETLHEECANLCQSERHAKTGTEE